MATNPYNAPRSRVADVPQQEAVPLWNPAAAGAWCLLLSTIFGSYLVMRNWAALGDPRERSARNWLYGSIAFVIAAIVIPGVGIIGLPWLIVWYFMANRPQIQHVKEQFGTDYPRQPWGKVLAVGFVVLVGAGIALGLLSTLVFGTGK